MKTTLNEILKHQPCEDGWDMLLESLSKTEADDEPLSLAYILKSNGIKDAIWALRCFDYKAYSLFNADVAESVLHIFEKKYPNDKRPRKVIDGIRDFHAGKITRKELSTLANAADAAYSAAYNDAYDAAVAAYAAAAAAYAAANSYDAYDAAVAAYAKQSKWDEIEELFIKHFCEDYNFLGEYDEHR